MRKWASRLAFDRGFLLGLIVLVVYLWLAPHHIVAADNAEFATLGEIGGHAHPSGYPLYVLWLRALSWLPAETAAHRAAIATSLLAVAQILVLHAACRAWGARASAATFAVAIFAAAPIVLRVHTEADVFALNSLIGSLVLWFAASDGPLRGHRRSAVLGLIAGLGIANNLTCVLLAPIGLWGVVRGVRESDSRGLAISLAIAGLALGLVPYAYLFVAPDAASWGPIHTFGDLADTVLRKDYGFTSHLPGGPTIPLATSLGAHAVLIGRTWLWAPALLALATMVVRSARGDARWAWRCLAATWVIAGPLFASRLGVDPAGVGGYIGGRMQILSAVVLAIGVAVGFESIARRASTTLAPRTAAIGGALLFVVLAVVAFPRLQRVHSRAVEAGVHNLLRSLPANAIAIVVSEDQCFGTRYLQLVDGERPDATVVCAALVTRDWYRARLATAGVSLERSLGGPLPVAQAEALLATGRPLLVDRAQSAILAALPSYPLGVLRRVLPRGATPPSLGEIVALDRDLYAQLDLDYPRPTKEDDFAAVAHLRYAGTWKELARALDAVGDHAGATAARDLAAQLAPD